jgi:hypothetical protein
MAIPRVLLAKYEGKCAYCEKKVHLGEAIVWEKGEGVAHASHFSGKELQTEGLIRRIRRV